MTVTMGISGMLRDNAPLKIQVLTIFAGLHGLLKSIQKPCNIKKFAGQTLGVDAYGWLHRGTIACAYELVLGKPTTKYARFFTNIRLLDKARC